MLNGKKHNRLMLGASLVALTVAIAPAGFAQTSTATSTEESTAVGDVIVVGARAAERSAIDRKKRASTVGDSIVADDVGQFPDKNAAEAIARIAGVALDYSDSGEAHGFTIRGQGADLVRVEIDGMSSLGAQIAAAVPDGDRQGQLNALSSDLIKSVDVVKGQTADMTAGGVGGTVRIEQRNGLDFQKPLVKLNVQFQGTDMHGKWTPRINFVGTRKFLDGRLGALLNVTYDKAMPSQDFMRISGGGWAPYGDLDNSPDKTFVSPYDPVAAAVTTKAGCLALPTTAAGNTAYLGTVPNGTPVSAIDSRRNCFAQWEDYVPQRIRYGRGVRVDETISAQLRLDYRVSDNLKVFVSANPNIRNFFSKDYNLDLAAPTVGETNFAGYRTGNILSGTTSPTHYVTSYVQEVSLSTTALTNPTNGAQYRSRGPTNYATGGLTYPIQIRDLYRDQETNYYQAGADFDILGWTGQARAQLSQAKTDRIDIVTTLNLPVQRLTFTQLPNSGAWNFTADTFTAGVSTYDPAAYYPQVQTVGATTTAAATTSPAFNATTGLSNTSISYFFDPRGAEDSEETNLQLDLTRDLEIFGPLKRIKVGIQKRDFTNDSWRPTFGEQVSPTVRLQSQAHTDIINACRPTGTATSCTPGAVTQINGTQVGGVLGTSSGALGNNFLAQRAALTEDQYKQLIDAIITPLPGAQFMAGVVDPELLQGWATINTDPIDPLLRSFGINLQYRDNQDCLYRCIASDGNFYDRPSVGTEEGTLSMYAMADFESRIFGMEVQGNFGVRYQKIDVTGVSVTQVYNRVYQPVTNTATPPVTRVTNVDTLVTTRESTFTNKSDDLMPSVNLTIWPIEDKVAVRFTRAKQRARPNLRQLAGAAGISCFNIDESQRDFIEQQLQADPTLLDDGNPQTDDSSEIGNFFENTFRDRCTGRIGNPTLSGYSATTSNVALEWYPNRDTNVSLTYYRINTQTGRPQNENAIEDFIIDGNPYLVDSYLDGDGGLKTQGVEFNARTAFTFLPSILRHTGAGFNSSTTKSSGGVIRTDVLSGQKIEPAGQSSYYYNFNVWYDDGRINARVAYQTRDHYYTGNGPTANNRIPVPESASVGDGGFGGSVATSYFKSWQPIYRSTTKNLDARMSYTVNERLQLFIEGKNLLDDVVERYTPRELRDPGTPAELMQDIQYNGRRYYTGLIFTF